MGAPCIFSVRRLAMRPCGIKQFLEEKLSIEVDVTTRNSLRPMLRTDIEKSAVRVF
ncbi:DNA polymerase III subunit beta [Sinorhizobium meliloti CCBAU 01290]|nr:DNA polymerase III subunit beta [Sinorhizobium meliloti CCBAU 01290]